MSPEVFGVRVKGLEPSRIAAPDPKSGVYTNFTTPAVTFYGGKSAKARQRYDDLLK